MKSSKEHIDDSLMQIRKIFEAVEERIAVLKPGEKITRTGLANDLGKIFGIPGSSLYPTLMFLIKDYPGVKVTAGAKGGIEKLEEEK